MSRARCEIFSRRHWITKFKNVYDKSDVMIILLSSFSFSFSSSAQTESVLLLLIERQKLHQTWLPFSLPLLLRLQCLVPFASVFFWLPLPPSLILVAQRLPLPTCNQSAVIHGDDWTKIQRYEDRFNTERSNSKTTLKHSEHHCQTNKQWRDNCFFFFLGGNKCERFRY